MTEKAAFLLERAGWKVTSNDPFNDLATTFTHQDVSIATGKAARLVLESILREDEENFKRGHWDDGQGG